MRRATSLAFVGMLPVAAFAAGCGGDETTASRSAAAFDEAQRKGTAPTGGEAHGHHGEADGPKDGSAAGPAARSDGSGGGVGVDHARMTGMDTHMADRTGGHGVHPRSNAAGTARPPRAPQASAAMAGMDHATMPGMDHSRRAQPGGGAVPPIADQAAAVATPEGLVATLRPDGLDAPAATAVREAARSAEIAREMAGGGHGMSHGTYRQIDAGREEVAPTPSGHEGHQTTPTAPPPTPRPREDNR